MSKLNEIVLRLERLAGKVDNPCPRCGGSGRIPSFGHIDQGICYACKGTGEAPKGYGSPKRTRGPEATQEEKVKMTIDSLHTYYSNFSKVRKSKDPEALREFWFEWAGEARGTTKELIHAGKTAFEEAVLGDLKELAALGQRPRAIKALQAFRKLGLSLRP